MSHSRLPAYVPAGAMGGALGDDNDPRDDLPYAPLPRTGGATLTEARRAELGRVRLHVRIAAASLKRLDELCADSGFTRPEQIEALIDCEHDMGPQKK